LPSQTQSYFYSPGLSKYIQALLSNGAGSRQLGQRKSLISLGAPEAKEIRFLSGQTAPSALYRKLIQHNRTEVSDPKELNTLMALKVK
jgi:hypothetical protein